MSDLYVQVLSSASELSLRALQSTHTANVDHIEVLADLQLDGRKDALLEQVVGRLSLEKSVSSVRWELSLTSRRQVRRYLEARRVSKKQKFRWTYDRHIFAGRQTDD